MHMMDEPKSNFGGLFMRKSILIFLVIGLLSLLLVACGGSSDSGDSDSAESGGDPANGETLYKQQVIGSASSPGCITCHSLEPDVIVVGPSHVGVATRAETAVPGMSAEEYLRQSILEPDAHVVEGFTPGVMYQNYAAELPAPVVDDLVAFLLTLK
jgi:hypothetical protein